MEIVDQLNMRNHTVFHLIDCIVDVVDLVGAFELNTHVVFENCIINKLDIHSCWFVNGFVMKNCIVNNSIDYQMGGHNLAPIILTGNVFRGFFSFFDCQFDSIVEIKNNVFEHGTNLLGNTDEGFKNTFDHGWIVENNVGKTNVNEVI